MPKRGQEDRNDHKVWMQEIYGALREAVSGRNAFVLSCVGSVCDVGLRLAGMMGKRVTVSIACMCECVFYTCVGVVV